MSLDTTKADDIALVIEEAIVAGELEPGTVLRQEQLSEQFNVSRTPIREALRRLAALGLVSFVPNRGVRVRTISREDLHEAFMVRAELESLATEVAATKMTQEDHAEQHRAIKQALTAGSASGSRALAREHVLSSFELLETILEQVGAQPRDWQRGRAARRGASA